MPDLWPGPPHPETVLLRARLPIAPQSKERPLAVTRRDGSRGAITRARTKTFEDGARLLLVSKWRGPRPVKAPLGMWVWFHTRKAQADMDNMIKALWDAGNKHTWADDRQFDALVCLVDRSPAVECIDVIVWDMTLRAAAGDPDPREPGRQPRRSAPGAPTTAR